MVTRTEAGPQAASVTQGSSVQLSEILKELGKHVLLIGAGLFFAVPFLWMVSSALKSANEIVTWPPTIIPEKWMWSNFVEATQYIPFFKYFGNTLYLVVAKVIGSVLSCSLAAYGFSRISWPGREAVFVLVLSTMMLPYQVTMIPLYVTFDRLGWIGSYWPLIVPSWFGSAFFIFMLRQFFRTLPLELNEAARVDGCSEFRIYWQIILPLARPALATLVLYVFMNTWSDFFGPLLYLTKQERWTLSLGLLQFRSQHDTVWELLMAASTLVTLPSIIIYFFGQKTFIQGIATTGFK